MELFIPDVCYVDPIALKYERGIEIEKRIRDFGVPLIRSKMVKLKNDSPFGLYAESKRTILLTVSKVKKLPACKPSADYQFSLSSSCPGNCEYCYLQTTQGEKPVIKIFANVDEILSIVNMHINDNLPNVTSFECASITDPVGVEHLTGSLGRCIKYFGTTENGKLRVVTKFNNIDPFLDIKHNGNTKFRFSVNAQYVIDNFEHKTANLLDRVTAAKKAAMAGYPIGFIIAPIMYFDKWESHYIQLIDYLKETFYGYSKNISFELISHRFTNNARELIKQRFPETALDLGEENRRLKWGPYGQFKHVYSKDIHDRMREHLTELINSSFLSPTIEYFT